MKKKRKILFLSTFKHALKFTPTLLLSPTFSPSLLLLLFSTRLWMIELKFFVFQFFNFFPALLFSPWVTFFFLLLWIFLFLHFSDWWESHRMGKANGGKGFSIPQEVQSLFRPAVFSSSFSNPFLSSQVGVSFFCLPKYPEKKQFSTLKDSNFRILFLLQSETIFVRDRILVFFFSFPFFLSLSLSLSV